MTLTQLAYVVAVDTHRHFGRAAAACHVTQPTLSMQLQKLERELGVAIFARDAQPVAATDLGALVVEQARRILRETARLGDLLDEQRGEPAGELRVGVIPTLGPYLLPRFVHVLAERAPGLRLRVEELPTEAVLDRLRADSLDAGLIATPEGAAGLEAEVLFDEPFVAYVNAAHPVADAEVIAPGQLSRDDMWLLSEAHCLRAQALQLCADGGGTGDTGPRCARGVRFESGNLETLKRLVESGDGLTLLPWLAAPAAADPRARVIPFAPPAPVRSVTLVRRREALKRPLVRAFVGALLESLPPELQASSAASAVPRAPGRRYFSYLELGNG